MGFPSAGFTERESLLKEKFVNGIDPPTKPILTSSETRHETVILSPEFAEAGADIWSITGAAVSVACAGYEPTVRVKTKSKINRFME